MPVRPCHRAALAAGFARTRGPGARADREVGRIPSSAISLALAATIALPSVVLLMMFGQTRVFFVMARDGLLPKGLSAVHPKFGTPWIITIITGVAVAIAAAFLPVSTLSPTIQTPAPCSPSLWCRWA